jgi:hypothetical protein
MSHRTYLFVVVLAAVAACAGADSAPPAAPAPSATQPESAAASPGADMQARCVATFTRQRECTDAFIPALVDLRISIDMPPGIAEAAATEGRDALIETAMTEWAEDSQPDAVAATCSSMTSSMPAEELDRLAAAADACLAETDCGAFVACIIPVMRHSMADTPR